MPVVRRVDTMVEDVVREVKAPAGIGASAAKAGAAAITARKLADISATEERSRIVTGISELDRVLGGGIVVGSVVLLGGEPGAGKSTLLLQLCGAISSKVDVLYITGEESTRQIKLRAMRLDVPQENISLAAETDIAAICDLIEATKPGLVVIDSIQTMHCADISSSSGSVSQVKECTARLLTVAKTHEIPTFIVGHVNKDGAIAGPKVMEHIVDTVLYFEGDKMLPYRVLRAAKNRYGSTNEIGMFDMTGKGLKVIENPSQLLLEGRPIGVSGNCVACTMEGTRPILSEIQALVSKTAFGTPRRAASGFDFNRMNLLNAVLEKRAGYFLGNLDVYINIVGGLGPGRNRLRSGRVHGHCLQYAGQARAGRYDRHWRSGPRRGSEERHQPGTAPAGSAAHGLYARRRAKHGLKQIDANEFPEVELIGVSYVRQAIGLL